MIEVASGLQSPVDPASLQGFSRLSNPSPPLLAQPGCGESRSVDANAAAERKRLGEDALGRRDLD